MGQLLFGFQHIIDAIDVTRKKNDAIDEPQFSNIGVTAVSGHHLCKIYRFMPLTYSQEKAELPGSMQSKYNLQKSQH